MKTPASLLLLAAAIGLCRTDVRFPESPKAEAKVDPTPRSANVSLAAGQFYVVTSPVELILLQDGPGQISFPAVARNGKTLPLTIPAELAAGYKTDKTDPDTGFSTVTFSDEFVYVGKPAVSGQVKVTAVPTKCVTKDAAGKETLRPLTKADVVSRIVDVNAAPQPPPDKKKDDTPPPKPVADAPLNVGDGKLRVLVVYDSLNPKMTPAQREVIFGADVRDWLGKNCAKDGYRIYPLKTIEGDPRFANDDKIWKDACARKRDSLPWCVISNGRTFYEGKLPEGESAFVAEATKYKP